MPTYEISFTLAAWLNGPFRGVSSDNMCSTSRGFPRWLVGRRRTRTMPRTWAVASGC